MNLWNHCFNQTKVKCKCRLFNSNSLKWIYHFIFVGPKHVNTCALQVNLKWNSYGSSVKETFTFGIVTPLQTKDFFFKWNFKIGPFKLLSFQFVLPFFWQLKVESHPKGSLLMETLFSRQQVADNTAQTALTPSLEQCQRASQGLKPHCVPVGLLLVQYITGRTGHCRGIKGTTELI